MIQLVKKDGSLAISQKLMRGEDGGHYIPDVDENGNLTWTPSEEDMPAVEGANILGPAGAKGDSGIYVGVEEPTDPNILVWLIPAGDTSDFVMTETEVKNYIDESLGEVEDGAY